MNKYSELYWVSVRSLVCRAQTAECQFCSLDNTLLYKISYTPSLLQIIHLLIPSNTWYHRWNTQFISHIRRHTISAHLLNSYNSPHQLSTTPSLTNQEHWLLLKVLLLLFINYMTYLFSFIQFLYCKCLIVCNNCVPLCVRLRYLLLYIFNCM